MKIEQITQIVSEESGINVEDIRSDKRSYPIPDARKVVCYLHSLYSKEDTKSLCIYLGYKNIRMLEYNIKVVHDWMTIHIQPKFLEKSRERVFSHLGSQKKESQTNKEIVAELLSIKSLINENKKEGVSVATDKINKLISLVENNKSA